MFFLLDTDFESLPTVEALNEKLPKGIRVYDIVVPSGTDFSARRTCDARTYEYLIPTYCFAPPPGATMYAYEPQDEQDNELVVPEGDVPKGGLFKTMKRSKEVIVEKPVENRQSIRQEKVHQQKEKAEKRNVFMRMIHNLFSTSKKTHKGSEKLKMELDATLQRPKRSTGGDEVETTKLQQNAPVDASTMGRDNFVTTLKRTLTRRTPPKHTVEDATDDEVKFFEPLDIPAPSKEDKEGIRSHKMTDEQFEQLRQMIGLFNGTHNWHNYIPGAAQSDPRCFIRILNIDVTEPEWHEGMEWVRIKVQAKAFARYMIRRMVTMLIMVMRTNTPRAAIANSYGFQSIDILEAPGFCLILDEPHYAYYNHQVLKTNPESAVQLDKYTEQMNAFRHDEIHDYIYKHEFNNLEFEAWLRSMDNYSFLYTHFLNERGLIAKQTNFIIAASEA